MLFEPQAHVGYFIGQKLQGDEAVWSYVGLVRDTHTTAAELLDDAVVRNGLANELGGTAHWWKC